MQIIVPDLDLDGLGGGTWGSNTDNTPPNRFPYVDGSQNPGGLLNDFAGFNQGTSRFRLLLDETTAVNSGWFFEITYRWTGGVGLQDPANFMTLRFTGPLGFVDQVIPSVGAPGVFTAGTFNWTDLEIASINNGASINFQVELIVSGLPSFWDVNLIELHAPSAGFEYTGDGGVELDTGNLNITGDGGIQVGQGLSATPMVLSADVSGMYTLIPGQRFDRVYTRNTSPDQTADVAIPTPFAKTGYFGA